MSTDAKKIPSDPKTTPRQTYSTGATEKKARGRLFLALRSWSRSRSALHKDSFVMQSTIEKGNAG